MASFNKVIIMGNLCRDPELRVTPKGTALCNLSVAVNDSYIDKGSGEKRETVTFVDVDVWGKQAEVIAKYLTKGRPILIEGRLKLDSWETKEGEKRSKLKVSLESFQFVGSQGDSPVGGDASEPTGGGNRPSAPYSSRPSAPASRPPSTARTVEDIDDIPF